jgi:hypothetical protein
LEKLAYGRFSDISFVAGRKRCDFCGLRKHVSASPTWSEQIRVGRSLSASGSGERLTSQAPHAGDKYTRTM